MDGRMEAVYGAVRDLLNDGEKPTLGAVSSMSGAADLTEAELEDVVGKVEEALTNPGGTEGDALAAVDGVDDTEVGTDKALGNAPRGGRKAKGGQTERVSSRDSQGKPLHFPTTLFKAGESGRAIANLKEYQAARKAGYRDLPELHPKVAEAIHRAGQDPGLHASQRARG